MECIIITHTHLLWEKVYTNPLSGHNSAQATTLIPKPPTPTHELSTAPTPYNARTAGYLAVHCTTHEARALSSPAGAGGG